MGISGTAPLILSTDWTIITLNHAPYLLVYLLTRDGRGEKKKKTFQALPFRLIRAKQWMERTDRQTDERGACRQKTDSGFFYMSNMQPKAQCRHSCDDNLSRITLVLCGDNSCCNRTLIYVCNMLRIWIYIIYTHSRVDRIHFCHKRIMKAAFDRLNNNPTTPSIAIGDICSTMIQKSA